MSRATNNQARGLRRLGGAIDQASGPAQGEDVSETFDLATIRDGTNTYAIIDAVDGAAFDGDIWCGSIRVNGVGATGTATGSHWQVVVSYDYDSGDPGSATWVAADYEKREWTGTSYATQETEMIFGNLGDDVVCQFWNANSAAPLCWDYAENAGSNDFHRGIHSGYAQGIKAIRIELDWTSGGPLTSITGTVEIYAKKLATTKQIVETFDLSVAGNQVNELESAFSKNYTFAVYVYDNVTKSGTTAAPAMYMESTRTDQYAAMYFTDNSTQANSQGQDEAGDRCVIYENQTQAASGFGIVPNINVVAPTFHYTYANLLSQNADNTGNPQRAQFSRWTPSNDNKVTSLYFNADSGTGTDTWGTAGVFYVVKCRMRAKVTTTSLSSQDMTGANGIEVTPASISGLVVVTAGGDTPLSQTGTAGGNSVRLLSGATADTDADHHQGIYHFNSSAAASTASNVAQLFPSVSTGNNIYFGMICTSLGEAIHTSTIAVGCGFDGSTAPWGYSQRSFNTDATAFDGLGLRSGSATSQSGDVYCVVYD